MKISIKIFAFFFSFVAYFLHAQTTFNANQILPCNTDIKIGKLDNELTYYIRANKYTERLTAFYLSVKAGSVLKTEEQIGLIHFTKHMGFNEKRIIKNAFVI
ncbi:MAG TPA: hypothetical protein PK495_00250 [Bacteroidales bacterium]|nr:hypothetical protein [Bacteroidales bacterium]